jgi:NADH dehydrogenase/NADH:ubiquinone oxidoreductase subunit G
MCLVDTELILPNGNIQKKIMIACGTTITNNLTIFTFNKVVKKIQENILEFLLINHPLDCPICDQGGECDLQDQAIIYGNDRNRFIEKKRSVNDKNFGIFIKSIMTRCIHCTRCVRFYNEIIGINKIGLLGRGMNNEIGTYNNSILNSEVSGNIIDLCPVGALTSKPFSFTGRS